jgi:hypothetical protein
VDRVDRTGGPEAGSDDARRHRREVLHDLTGLLAAAALRLEVVRRRQDPAGAVDADLAAVEAAVAEARRAVADLQAFEAGQEPDEG